MSKRDYYEVLGLTKSATDDEIKQAYRRGAGKYHPDRVPDSEKVHAEEKFKEIKEAYEVLSDPQRRASYDRFGHTGGPQTQRPRGVHPEMADILRAFGAAHGMGGFQGGFRQVVETEITITLSEAFKGKTAILQGGNGEQIEISIPAGCPSGYRTQVQVNQNLALIVNILVSDPSFNVRQAGECAVYATAVNGQQVAVVECGHVETELKLDALDLFLGAWTTIKGIEGEDISIRVPAGFDPSTRLRVKGKGTNHWVHSLNRAGARGDIFVRVLPIFHPAAKLDPEKVRQLYREATGERVDVKV